MQHPLLATVNFSSSLVFMAASTQIRKPVACSMHAIKCVCSLLCTYIMQCTQVGAITLMQLYLIPSHKLSACGMECIHMLIVTYVTNIITCMYASGAIVTYII